MKLNSFKIKLDLHLEPAGADLISLRNCIPPMAPVQTEAHLNISEHKMFFTSFSVRKKILENGNTLVVISLSKVEENEFFQTLKPINKVESSYCHYYKMLKLRKNKRNDLYILLAHRDVRKLTCLIAKFQEEPIEPLRLVKLWYMTNIPVLER